MGVKTIKGRSYYYQSVREGDRVRSVYKGGGAFATLTAALDRAGREDREADRRGWRAQRGQADARDKALAAFFDVGDAAARAFLEGRGYQQHARGHWRRRRTMTQALPPPPGMPSAAELDRLKPLLGRVRDGEAGALAELREWVRAYPGMAEGFGFAAAAESAALDAACGPECLLQREIYARQLEDTAAELAGPDPAPTVGLLARRAALCWLALCVEEARFSQARPAAVPGRVEHLAKLLDRRHNQFLRAVKTLALVRRLASGGAAVRVSTTQTQTVTVEATP